MSIVHIGHHFFGAGNIGDDLMLAGFLGAVRARAGEVTLSCCIPWDIAAMRRRFPEITWLPYDDAHRRDCIARCDAWLGLGDTPFQTSVGDWLLDHLLVEARMCEAAAKPMFYLGVGVNDDAAAVNPKTSSLVRRAAHLWTRDAASADILSTAGAGTRVTTGSDLAHVFLAEHLFAPVDPRVLALVLNFEDPAQFSLASLEALVDAVKARHDVRWVAQEVRALAGSEVTLHARMAERIRLAAPLAAPDYAGAQTVDALLAPVGTPAVMVTSRYHATLLAAWAGSRVAAFPRSLKVKTVAADLGIERIDDIRDVDATVRSIDRARPVAASTLERHAALAMRCCGEALDAMAAAG